MGSRVAAWQPFSLGAGSAAVKIRLGFCDEPRECCAADTSLLSARRGGSSANLLIELYCLDVQKQRLKCPSEQD